MSATVSDHLLERLAANGVHRVYGYPGDGINGIMGFDHTQCENDRANIANTKRIQTEILEAAGASDLLTIDRYAHLVGGCGMGTSPPNSVIDADHRVWGVPNLFVCDAA